MVVLAAVMLAAIAVALSFGIDVGRIVLEKTRLQNTSDAAALAAGQVLLIQHREGASEEDARAAATEAAEEVLAANHPDAAMQVEFGTTDEDGSFVAADMATEATAVRALASRQADAPGGALPMAFAGLLGVDSADVEAVGVTAVKSHIQGVTKGLRPFAVYEGDVPEPGQEMILYPGGEDNGNGNGNGNTQIVPGCWGLLDLNGGSNSNQETQDWILNGYDQVFSVDTDNGYIWIEGTPGFRASINDEINQVLNQSMTVVVYDEVTGQGANADFRCIGFLRMHITEAQLHGNDKHVTCAVEQIQNVSGLLAGDGWESPNVRRVQIVD
jgi:hypothetical protein